MVCKKCGKEFNSENNICPFCNEDNTVAETPVAAPETKEEMPAAPVETTVTPEKTEEPAATPVVASAETPTVPQPDPPEEKEEQEIEDLFDESKKEEPVKEELVIEEPKVTSETPVETPSTESVSDVPATASAPVENETTPVVTESESTTTPEVVAEEKPTTEETPAASGETPTEEKVEQPAPKKNNTKKLIFLIIIALLVAIVVYMYIPKGDEEETATNEPSTNQTTNQNNNNNNENTGNENSNTGNNTGNINKNEIFTYSGVYKNGDVTVTMHAVSSSKVNFTVGSIEGVGIENLELDKNNNLVFERNMLGTTLNIKVEKVDNGIKVTSSSSEEDSVFNKISNTYTKDSTVNSAWNGIYVNGDVEFVIDQYLDDELALNYADYKNNIYGQFENIDTFTDNVITYEREFFDTTTKIVIEKTIDGISVTTTSTDPEEDYTSLNGTFKKMN